MHRPMARHLPPLSTPPPSCKGYAHPGDEDSEAQSGQASCPGSHSQLGGARIGPVTSVSGGVHAFFPSGSLGSGQAPWNSGPSAHRSALWAGLGGPALAWALGITGAAGRGTESPHGGRVCAFSQCGVHSSRCGSGGEGSKLLVSLGLSIVRRWLLLVQMERQERAEGTWGHISCPLTSQRLSKETPPVRPWGLRSFHRVPPSVGAHLRLWQHHYPRGPSSVRGQAEGPPPPLSPLWSPPL